MMGSGMSRMLTGNPSKSTPYGRHGELYRSCTTEPHDIPKIEHCKPYDIYMQTV
jgi:hypothetical protein